MEEELTASVAITWRSSKQSVVTQSTTESEYIAASEAAKEAAWIKKFMTDLGVVPSIRKPIEILCDNTGAIAQEKEPRSHHRSKHILRQFHYIREVVERGDIKIDKIHIDQNLADPFTKPMPLSKHEEYVGKIGQRDAARCPTLSTLKELCDESSKLESVGYVMSDH
ncbi:hypothetical protein E3N88_26045 [Mikania micrantha]|uniref:Reverse transcriptase Ty1/copia-type domain-containing protein n=1 Tax=Mikania micrantha TaxID=192012 RepID=A0A5N6N7W6_9ASTR|nr:hypothetical protein E3N88_26045 [Mikania micrantha]